jgi:hypothetical protein
MVYEKGGKGIHVPLASDHALVVLMKESLGVSANSSSSSSAAAGAAEVHTGAREVALALKDLVVRAQVGATRQETCVVTFKQLQVRVHDALCMCI